jgi:NAD(P) transhydrogenase subunit alpha
METILGWIADNQQMIYIVILMIFVGIEVIGRVPSVLHTPLMSGANAIHGVVIIGRSTVIISL